MEPIYKVTDERFDVGNLDQHDLSIEISTERFRFSLKNISSGLIVWLEDYYLGGGADFEENQSIIEKIYAEHQFLAANFWHKVQVSFVSPFHLVCPEHLFMPGKEKDYLNILFDHKLSENFAFRHRNFKESQTTLLIAYPAYFQHFFASKYPKEKTTFHFTAEEITRSLVEGQDPENLVYIFLDDSCITFYYLDQFNTLQIERFPLQSKEYINLIKNFGDKLCFVFGELTLYSPTFKTLQTTCKNIKFGSSSARVKFSQYFQDLPQHRYVSLFLLS